MLKSKQLICIESLFYGWSNILLCFHPVKDKRGSAQTSAATVLRKALTVKIRMAS